MPVVLNRRQMLRQGLSVLGGLSLPGLLRLRATGAEPAPRRTALILVWLPGGASHLETYDPKPGATNEYRGPFATIPTAVPGIQLGELLPHHARVAQRFSLLRSLVHTGFCHQQGTQQLLTGHPVRELKQKPDDPDLLSIAHYLRHDAARELPNYVGIPAINYGGPAYLGGAYEPFTISGDPNAPQFQVPNITLSSDAEQARILSRVALSRQFDRFSRAVDQRATMGAVDAFDVQALSLLTGTRAREAFDLSREDAGTRERYGRNSWGQQLLMARRLVEAGIDLVTVQLGGPLCGRVGNWDDHAVNHHVFDALKYRCQFFDQGVAALIEDVFARGLDQRTLIVVTGEFGRTPKINYQPSTGGGIGSGATGTVQPGRDHWPSATSLLFAGGGIPGGQVIGATDPRGEQVVDRRVTTGDFLATLYRHLGIDAERISVTNFAGRPVPILPYGGRAIPELTSG
ncbi:MAG: DUF1501 domain-containing protein [Planctomycetes bacterium]|nr:DUF1501 domain-containing protein [Planctomycetota bacterium]